MTVLISMEEFEVDERHIMLLYGAHPGHENLELLMKLTRLVRQLLHDPGN